MWSPVVPHLPNLVRAFNGIVPVLCPAHSSSIVKDWLHTFAPSCKFICLYLRLLLSLCVYWCSGCVLLYTKDLESLRAKSCPNLLTIPVPLTEVLPKPPVEEKPACHFLDRGLFKKETICARPVPRGHQDFFSHLNGHHRSSHALFKLNEEQMHLKLSWFVLSDLTYLK